MALFLLGTREFVAKEVSLTDRSREHCAGLIDMGQFRTLDC